MMYRILLVVGVLVLLVTSCSTDRETNVEFGNRNNILFVGNGEEPRGLDPHIITGSPDFNVIMSLFEGLTVSHPKTLEPQPAAAESWEISDDGLTYTFKMRKNARWSNGDPVTAHDFVWSWKRALSPGLANEFAYLMYYIEGAEAFNTGKTDDFDTVAVKALDDYTLQVKLANPAPFFLRMITNQTFMPVHKATILKHGDMDSRVSKWTRPEHHVSNGAFTLADWRINDLIAVDKNPHYWDADQVALEGIRFLPITDQQAEERAFRTGQVHVTNTPQMAIEKIAVYQKNNPEQLQKIYSYSSYYYLVNTNHPVLSDSRVRRALAMAIDRESIARNVTKAGEKPAYSIIPPDPTGYQPEQYFEYNPEKARALLAEAGYPNGEGVGTIEIHTNPLDIHKKVAVAIQQMLKNNLNIDVQLVTEEWKVYLNSQKNRDFDLSRQGWIADYLDPSNFVELMLSYSGNNNTGWANEEYDRLIEQAKTLADNDARYALYQKANKILAEEMPAIPIYYYSDINLKQPYVKGWHPNLLHRHPYKFVYLDPPSDDQD